MKPEAQRIAIAEACGYRQIVFESMDCPNNSGWFGFPKSHIGNVGGSFDKRRIPDYLTDLNAMHAAEKGLKGEQREKYWETLCLTVPLSGDNSTNAWSATAAQRAEAFLRTLGLWKE